MAKFLYNKFREKSFAKNRNFAKFSRKTGGKISRKVLAASSRTSSVLHDDEFGDIEIRRVRGNTLRLKIQTSGKLVAQLPHFTSVREVSRLLENNRASLRKSLKSMPTIKTYADGDQIGKSHVLRIREGVRENSEVKGLEIIVTKNSRTSEKTLETLVKDGVAKALRKEAKAYLPRRLKFFAMKYGFRVEKIQFSHAKSRWGSRSSSGTISLNIMLMTLPPELTDYVLLHELTHIKHMDHSADFWRDLDRIFRETYPHYIGGAKGARKALGAFSPYI